MSRGVVQEGVRRLLAAAESGDLDRLAEAHGVRLLGIFGSAAARTASRLTSTSPCPSSMRPMSSASSGPSRTSPMSTGSTSPSSTGPSPCSAPKASSGSPCTKGLYANEQMAALAERRDTAWLRRLDLNTLAEGRTIF